MSGLVKTLLNYVPTFACILLVLCIVQALYFPFLTSEDLVTPWWQSGAMAGVGVVIGFPVLLVWEAVFKSLPFAEAAYWVLSGGYVLCIYLSGRAMFRLLKRISEKNPGES